MSTYATTQTQRVSAANGIDYAYRSIGGDKGLPPLVLLQHFRGNLDNWDPALVDTLAQDRHVITFDNTGVGASTGRTPRTIAQSWPASICWDSRSAASSPRRSR